MRRKTSVSSALSLWWPRMHVSWQDHYCPIETKGAGRARRRRLRDGTCDLVPREILAMSIASISQICRCTASGNLATGPFSGCDCASDCGELWRKPSARRATSVATGDPTSYLDCREIMGQLSAHTLSIADDIGLVVTSLLSVELLKSS